MSTDGAECATAKTSTMQIHRELNHLVSRNALALVFWMRQTRIRQVERAVEFIGSHRRIHRIHHCILAIDTLNQTLGLHSVRLLLDMTKVFSLSLFVAQTLLMTMKHNIIGGYTTKNAFLSTKIHSLWNVLYLVYLLAFAKLATKLNNRFLTHTIYYHVGTRVAKYTFLQSVLPVVIMSEPSKRSLYSTQYYRHIGKQLLQNLSIDNCRILRTAVVTTIWTIGILRTQALSCCILVDH